MHPSRHLISRLRRQLLLEAKPYYEKTAAAFAVAAFVLFFGAVAIGDFAEIVFGEVLFFKGAEEAFYLVQKFCNAITAKFCSVQHCINAGGYRSHCENGKQDPFYDFHISYLHFISGYLYYTRKR